MKKILALVILFILNTSVYAYDNKNLLNPLIKSYSYPPIQADNKKITEFLLAVCDLTEFDYKDYDTDRIYRHVLYTNKKFQSLVKEKPQSMSVDNISYINSAYIDSIMTDILGIEPFHPPFALLIDKGYCYRADKYMYSGGFNAEYDTKINKIISVLDLGSGRRYVIFSDTYTENNKSENEYSYAVIDTSKEPYRLLSLKMGGELLDNSSLLAYADTQNYQRRKYNPLIPALLGIFILCIIIAIVIIIRYEPKEEEIS